MKPEPIRCGWCGKFISPNSESRVRADYAYGGHGGDPELIDVYPICERCHQEDMKSDAALQAAKGGDNVG